MKGEKVDEALNNKVVEYIKSINELKKLYIEIQNDMLYEKWTLNEKKGRTESLRTNCHAFITFKSMTGKNVA